MKHQLSRRTMLRGLGCAVALPWLESMGNLSNWASGAAPASGKAAPNRMAFLYVPNGKNMADWTPAAEGAFTDLPSILKPLEALKKDFMILSGLAADKARSNGDGGGDHARAMAAFLTGCQPRKTDGADIRAGVSVDQVAAARIGEQTRLASLEIGCEAGAMAGNCDSGYSCVYSSTMSWRSATSPLPKETNPKLVFERMFGAGGDADRARRNANRKSVMDFVRADAGDLTKKVGATDKRKLDEYFTAIRDIELRIEKAARLPEPERPAWTPPGAVPAEYAQHIRIMCDLLVLAFQTDVTRVCTFALANEGSNRPYPFINIREGHHELSHHGNDPKKKEKIRDINTFHTQHLAYLLGRLKEIKEGDGMLLDHCMIAYGSGNADGNAHSHHDLPILLAGRGCGTLSPGRHVRYTKETPLNNLWMSMLDRMEVKIDGLGDATGRLKGLS